MNRQTLLFSGIGVVAVALVLVLVFSSGSNTELPAPDGAVEGSTSTASFLPDLVNAAHQFNSENENHIVAGSAEVKNGCMQLSQTVSLRDNARTATIQFRTSNPTPDAVCTQAVTDRRFKTTFATPEDVEITATYNGEPVELNLRPVAEGENLEDFEVYTKG